MSPEGTKVEVKSAAYLQSWHQDAPSKISFGIAPTVGWDARTNSYSSERRRQADVYVFCLLNHRDKSTVNPLDTGQWTFYVANSRTIDSIAGEQKSITLSALVTRIRPTEVGYRGLAGAVHTIAY